MILGRLSGKLGGQTAYKNPLKKYQLLDTVREALGLCFGVLVSLQVAFQDPPPRQSEVTTRSRGGPF